MRRPSVLLISVSIWIAACGGTTGPAPSSTSSAHPGILVVGAGEQVQARPPDGNIAAAFDIAMQLARANGNDLGYPWVDPTSGALVVSVVTEHGRELVEQAGISVPYSVRQVSHGVAELSKIQDDATGLTGEGMPGADLIFETLPDHRDNRTLLRIRSDSPELLQALATRFPADTLAVQEHAGR